MPRTTQQNEQIREKTRQAIVQSAITLFAQHGYAHTTTRNIAEQAGISTGLMYHYFSGKESLLQAVFDQCMALISDQFERAVAEEGAEHRLSAIVRTIFTMLEADPDFWGLFYMLRTQPAITPVLGDDFLMWTARLRDLFVSELSQAGRADPELDALLLYSLIEGTIQQYLLDPDHYPLEKVSAEIIAQYGP